MRDKWDGSALKNTLDDAVKKVMLDNYGYSESHSLMNGRLLICTVSVGFALYALVWDYFFPFPESRPVLITCVISYFIMMGVLTVYTTFKEKGIFLVAHEKDRAGIDPDNIWQVASQLKRYDDNYHLHFTYIDGQTKEARSASMVKSVSNFYDINGSLCMDIFEPEIRRLHTDLTSERKDK